MGSLREDIDFALSDRRNLDFGFIYSRTNEELLTLFSQINVKGEDVCTVLSSSDYLFSAIDGGARSVDTFDINPLTYRYYYLRKWLLQQEKLDAEGLHVKEISEVVKKRWPAISKDEEESSIFWETYLTLADNSILYENQLFAHPHQPNTGYASNINEFAKKVSSFEIKFKSINICSRRFASDKKYDTVFLSNILDYNRNSGIKLRIVSDNLSRLLNSGGRVVLSSFCNGYLMDTEKRVFSSHFDYVPLSSSSLEEYEYISYYQYVKR